jgi:dienelactone hydrolase
MAPPRSQQRLQARRRRRALTLGAVVVVLAVAVVAGAISLFGGDGGGDAPDPVAGSANATSSTSTTAAPTSTAPTSAPVGEPSTRAPATASQSALDTSRRYAVGTTTRTFVDSSRTTSANGSFVGAPTRTLPTEFWYPAQGTAGGDGAADATPDKDHGPYPLVLFAHGYAVTPDFYAPLLARWAAAGYVVAAPVFPILSGSDGGASHVDYEKTFADASFVITQVLHLPNGDLLGGLVDPARIAAAGHSDGEVVSFGVGFLDCCRDARVRSVVAMAGDLSNADNPHTRGTGTPILHIMETNDEYDPYPHSIQWDRENLTAPRWMVSLNASHVPPYTQPGDPAFELVSSITVAFFDGTLKGHPESLENVSSEVNAQPDVGSIER